MAVKVGTPILSIYKDENGHQVKVPIPAIKGEPYKHSEEFENLSTQVHEDAIASATSAVAASQSAGKAATSEANAKASENASIQKVNEINDVKQKLDNVPVLVDQKIPLSYIPATAITEIFEITSKEELIMLGAQKGDLAELIEEIGEPAERTVTKTWQLLGDDPTILENWIVWGTSYSVRAGSSSIAETSNNSERINGMRLETMTYTEFQSVKKDPNTLYAIDMGA